MLNPSLGNDLQNYTVQVVQLRNSEPGTINVKRKTARIEDVVYYLIDIFNMGPILELVI